MPQDFDIFGNMWWRFDRYDVSGGYIRPGRGARLEQYKPWAEFRDARAVSQRSNIIQRPYSSLFQLADNLEKFGQVDGAGKLIALPGVPAGIEVEIVRWCQRYGLLGLLLQSAEWVNLAPRWEKSKIHPGDLDQVLTQYFRSTEGWNGLPRERIELSPPLSGFPPEGGIVRRDEWRGSLTPSVVSIRGLIKNDFDLEPQPLSQAWHPFFPSVPTAEAETFKYPQPLTNKFWHLYAEPLLDFAKAVIALREAVLALSEPQQVRQNSERAQASGAILTALMSGTAPICAVMPDGTVRQQFVPPSLLAAFSLMALQDIAEENRVVRCEACNRTFVTKAQKGVYCSTACGWKMQKRRQRVASKSTRQAGSGKKPQKRISKRS